MTARGKARKQALDILFESDIRNSSPVELLSTRLADLAGPDARPVREYAQELVNGVVEHQRKIDELISTYAQGWDMDRLPAVDRNVLRIAIYELLWREDIPDAVAIDEALTLAKLLSTDESAGYIHGVLGRISSIKTDLAL
ncbi:MAG TPA: transcription antitermination factor NusB [Candidatus Paceibacterota bacterium]|nr:transcription antitermination factor NusB [Candidatus Paceibacterota bacterium]